MEALNHLHPIFEFFMTLYVGFMIAPEFMGRFLLEKLPDNIDKSKKRASSRLEKSKLIIVNYKNELPTPKGVPDKSWESLHEDYVKTLNENIDSVEILYNDIEKEAKRIVEEKDKEGLKISLAKSIRDCYDNVFPFAAMYCFVMLLINGCHWGTDHDNEWDFFIGIINFNAFCLFWLSALIYWKKILRGLKPNKNKRQVLIFAIIKRFLSKIKNWPYYYWYSILISSGFIWFAFFVFPFHRIFTIQYSLIAVQSIAMGSSIFISFFPMLCLGIELVSNFPKKYCELTFKDRFLGLEANIRATINDIEYKTRRNFKRPSS